MGNGRIRDPFLDLYGEIQDVWNDKKGLEYLDNPRSRAAIFNRLKKFVDSLSERQKLLNEEIQLLKRIYEEDKSK